MEEKDIKKKEEIPKEEKGLIHINTNNMKILKKGIIMVNIILLGKSLNMLILNLFTQEREKWRTIIKKNINMKIVI